LGTKHRLYGELKRKRHLYLTDTAYKHLVDLAQATHSSPSQICEQILRQEIPAATGTQPPT
jgi:hypothetical protein